MSDLVERLRKRAEIRRQIQSRKSVQEGKPDRLADLLEEAAIELERVYENPECRCGDNYLEQRSPIRSTQLHGVLLHSVRQPYGSCEMAQQGDVAEKDR